MDVWERQLRMKDRGEWEEKYKNDLNSSPFFMTRPSLIAWVETIERLFKLYKK